MEASDRDLLSPLLLFVVPAPGGELDDDLKDRRRAASPARLPPRRVPDDTHQVPGTPRTLSGKKLEVPVRKILLGADPEQAVDPNARADPYALGPSAASRKVPIPSGYLKQQTRHNEVAGFVRAGTGREETRQ